MAKIRLTNLKPDGGVWVNVTPGTVFFRSKDSHWFIASDKQWSDLDNAKNDNYSVAVTLYEELSKRKETTNKYDDIVVEFADKYKVDDIFHHPIVAWWTEKAERPQEAVEKLNKIKDYGIF